MGILNSDDCFHDPTVLSRISSELENTDIVHGGLDFVDNHISKRIKRQWRARPRPTLGFRTGWMPAHPTFYVRRKVAETVGAFDLSFKVASDYDWMLRAIELHGFSLSMVDGVMIDMMVGGASTRNIGSYLKHNMEALRSRRQWFGGGIVDYALFAKPTRKVGQFVLGANKFRKKYVDLDKSLEKN